MDITELVGAVQSLNAEDAFRPRFNFDQWRALSQYLTQHEIRGGDLLVRQGSSDRTVYFLARGSLQVFASGGGHRVTVLRPGALVGEAGLFLDAPHRVNVEAMTPCAVWALRAPRVEELAQRVPALAIELLRAAGAVMAVRLAASAPRAAA
jgi:CRP/FNR family cyclic AMP-dependent transcriptional regulator